MVEFIFLCPIICFNKFITRITLGAVKIIKSLNEIKKRNMEVTEFQNSSWHCFELKSDADTRDLPRFFD